MRGIITRLRHGSVRSDWALSMWCRPGAKRFAKKRIHKAERHQPVEMDGILPLNVMVKGEVKGKPRVRAIVVNVAPNVFDIVYR